VIALQFDILFIDRSASSALALQVAERLLQLSGSASEAADDGYDFSTFAFLEPDFERLFFGRRIDNRLWEWRALAEFRIAAALFAEQRAFKRSSIEKSHGVSTLGRQSSRPYAASLD